MVVTFAKSMTYLIEPFSLHGTWSSINFKESEALQPSMMKGDLFAWEPNRRIENY